MNQSVNFYTHILELVESVYNSLPVKFVYQLGNSLVYHVFVSERRGGGMCDDLTRTSKNGQYCPFPVG